jgi:hypothetical protein
LVVAVEMHGAACATVVGLQLFELVKVRVRMFQVRVMRIARAAMWAARV